MTVGDGYEYESERNEGLANAKPEDEQPAGDQFHDRDDQSDRPEQPDWDPRISVRKKEASNMSRWREHETFPVTGHAENQAENDARERHRPRAQIEQ